MNNSEFYLYQKSYLKKYLDTKEREIGLLVMYAIATHIYDKYQNFPIMHFLGDFQTAKNRRLELLDPICLNPTIVTNSTLPSLFRTTDEYKGTIMLDEADYILGFNDIKNFLLSGYQKGVKITRMVPDSKHDKGYRPVDFEIFGPKIIVTREGSDDEALNSRSIIIITLPKSADSTVPDILPAEAKLEGEEIKKRIEIMVSNIGDINSDEITLGLRGRDAQLFKPLVDVAYIYGDEALNELRDFVNNEYIPESKYDTMLTIQEELIRALVDIWEKGQIAHLRTLTSILEDISSDYRNISSKRIAKVLRSLGFKTDERDKYGQYVTPNSELTSLLKAKYQIDEDSREANVANVVETEKAIATKVPPVDRLDSFPKEYLQ